MRLHSLIQDNNSGQLGLIGTVAVFIACTVGLGACRSGEPKTLACPPSMAPAGSQNICIQGTCGNGVIDPDEECDDGNQIAGDGCSLDCRSAEICGNAIVDHAVGEVCDDGNTDPDDRCCNDCRSCPDRAVALLDEAPEPVIERTPSAAHPCPAVTPVQATQPPRSLERLLRSPVEVRSQLVGLFLQQTESAPATVPAPLQFMSSQVPLVFELPLSAADIPAADPPGWITDELARVRANADELEQRLRSKSRAHRRLKRTEELLIEELQSARDMIAQLEQINAELHQYLGSECLQLPRGRSNGLQ